jgi:hypothetical protein
VEGIAEKEKQRKTGGGVIIEEAIGVIRNVNNLSIR